MNGDYFPELKKKAAQAAIPINSRVSKKTDNNR